MVEDIVKKFSAEEKRQTTEQTHTRRTYLIRNDLVERLETEAKRHSRGWPTRLINGLLESYFLDLDSSRDSFS